MAIKTILATCYSMNPYKGSIDGMSWNFIVQIARVQKVIAITRKKNQVQIEKYLNENTNPAFNNITFLYFDLHNWMRVWEKNGRAELLHYYMWQRGIVPFIKRQSLRFDSVHNVTFSSNWMPNFLWKLTKPTIWRTVSNNSRIPKQTIKLNSKKKHLIYELNWIIKSLIWNKSQSIQKTIANSNPIWSMNHNAPNSQELKEANKSVHLPVTSIDFTAPKQMNSEKFNVLSIDRFGSLMEFNLTINAFISFVRSLPKTEQYNCKLTLIGTRDEKELYQKIIVQNDAKDRIEILDCMDQKSLMQKYQNAKVFLFPSHEAAGIVIAEALSFGLPVICLDNDHPGQYITDSIGIAVPDQAFNETVNDLKLALLKLYKIPHLTEIMSNQARKHFEENYIGKSRGTHLKNTYDETA